jgi:predicted transcriptional regulator
VVAEHPQRVALMAIQPVYARAILNGNKRIEFRKRPLARDIRTVIIYETAPTQLVVGEFDVADIVVGSPRVLWQSYGGVGGISETSFFAYFEGYRVGTALLVASYRQYEHPITLDDLRPGIAVPQSFFYLAKDVLDGRPTPTRPTRR